MILINVKNTNCDIFERTNQIHNGIIPYQSNGNFTDGKIIYKHTINEYIIQLYFLKNM